VLAREFVPVAHRGEIPQVPACSACNSEKATLEHYLTSVLPFGGRHADALDNLSNNVPKRLEKDKKLHRALAAGSSREWSPEPSGILRHSVTVPLDGEKLEKLVAFIVRGLAFHHWGVVLGADMVVDVHSLTKRGEGVYKQLGALNASQKIMGNIGQGALVYEAAQGVDNPAVSVWQLSLYGGVTMASADGRDFTSSFGAMTGPKAVFERARDRAEQLDRLRQATIFQKG
jgi:hypothetical protein